MAIKGSGPLSFTDITAEFSDTPPHSLSEFYRGAGKVPSVNANVPTSGAISLGNFYNAVNELLIQVTSTASVNAQTIFGSNWGTAIPKRLLIPSGNTIGPLNIPSGMGGSLTVQNEGEIQGLAGGSNSGAGGHAITAASSFTLHNLGAVRGGGGGGGKGGTGGGGSYTQPVSQGPYGPDASYVYRLEENGEGEFRGYTIRWGGAVITSQNQGIGTSGSFGGWTYHRIGNTGPNFPVSRSQNQTINTNGGAGGNGGVGRGYGQSLTGGSSGAAGGTNAGTGGTGGTGGNWGSNGATGATGNSGNRTGGAAGSGGGAAGRAVLMNAGSLTVSATGTINGAY